MPEGHTIHRAARLQTRRFGRQALQVWSPQGRFSEEASQLDGKTLHRVDAHGKHLLYRWVDAPTLHVHLGLFGRFRVGPHVTPSPNARMAWRSATHTLALSGPTVCELVDDEDVSDLLARIGPDPLAPQLEDLERFRSGLARRSVPIGAALLDQRLLAGIGNVYRSELLFLAGIDPRTPARDLDQSQAERLWKLAGELLGDGERLGRIVTVDPIEVGVRRAGEVPRSARLYAYKRAGQDCRRCGGTIAATPMAGRDVWWCPVCQAG